VAEDALPGTRSSNLGSRSGPSAPDSFVSSFVANGDIT
jgi:hypothetical protein